MKTPTNYGGFNLGTWLASNNTFVIADLYTFTLADGTVLRYTSSDGDLVVNSNTFDGVSILIDRSKLRSVIGLEVDTLDLTITANPDHVIGTTPILEALRNRTFGRAWLSLDRYFAPTWGSGQYATVKMFSGWVGECEVGRFQANMRVNSALILLNLQMPKNLYAPNCANSVYDTGCQLSKAAFTASGTISSGSTATVLQTSLTQADGYFDLGEVTFTSGANNGISATVKGYVNSGGQITLFVPLPSVPSASDTFGIAPGCTKTYSLCNSRFGNTDNFRGQPWTPVPEATL